MTDPLARYNRQMLLPGFGEAGQRRLIAARVAIVGCGALGCAVAEQLTRAGVGAGVGAGDGGLTIIDRDVVESTNLQRQCLFSERDAAEGVPKAEAAARRLAEVNSTVRVRPVVADLSAANAQRLIEACDVLVDGTDNFDTRYLLNDLAVKRGVPFVYAGVVAACGMQMTVRPGVGPCLRCVFPEPPAPGTQPTCDTAGVLGAAVAIVASVQVAETLKLVLGEHEMLRGELLEFDLWTGTRREVRVQRDAECPACVHHRLDFLEGGRGVRAVWMCGQNSVQIFPSRDAAARAVDASDDGEDELPTIDLPAIAHRLRPHGDVTLTRFMARVALAGERGDDGGPVLLSVFPDGRSLIRGLRDPLRARVLYDRYVGA
ncbi:MAG: ThiF family adenylyltransferase [Planctomycetota bacterium]